MLATQVFLATFITKPMAPSATCATVNDEDFKAAGAQVLDAFHDWVAGGAGGQSHWALEEVNHEGWRVNVDEGDGKRGWLLLRQSLHDPLLVLNVESDRVGGEGCSTASVHLAHCTALHDVAPLLSLLC